MFKIAHPLAERKQDVRWEKQDHQTLVCKRIDASITRHPDRFVVKVGDHTREHYSLVGARVLAERMHREIEEFDQWGERRPPNLSLVSIRYRSAKLGRAMGRRVVMAGTIALVAGLAGMLLG